MGKAVCRLMGLIVGVTALMIACRNDADFPKSPYPRIDMHPITNVTEEGATFQASITDFGTNQILNHGFVWDSTPNPTIEETSKVELGAVSGEKDFEITAKTGFDIGIKYYVRAFAKTSSRLVYAPVVSFVSKGSTPPSIKSFSPVQGTWGDTLSIEGTNFGGQPKQIEVKFETLNAEVIGITDTKLKVIVPKNIASKTVKIHVTTRGKSAEAPTDFILIAPIIQSFSPPVGTFKDIVTIKGSYFSKVKQTNIVMLGDKVAEVVSSTSSELKVKVPTALRLKENKITITVNLQSGEANTPFVIAGPIITSLSNTSGAIYSLVDVFGSNFNPETSGNTVSLGDAPAGIYNFPESYIHVEVPDGFYKSRTVKIGVTVAEQSALSSQTFTVTDTWLKKCKLPQPMNEPVSFVINEVGYTGLGAAANGNKIYRFNPTEANWTEIAPFPGEAKNGATTFVIGDKAYVGLGNQGVAGGSQDFWSYSSTSNSWSRIANFPFNAFQAKGFTFNGYGYVVTKDATNNFWKYDPGLNIWTAMPDLTDVIGRVDAGFVVGNRLFVYLADETTLENQLSEFDFNSNTWSSKAPEPRNFNVEYWTTGFSLNGMGYIRRRSDLIQYDPTTNIWTSARRDRIGPHALAVAFVVNNKFYICGNSNGVLWEYDPAYEPY